MGLRRYELTDEEWALIAHHFAPAGTGRPPGDYRRRLDAIMWILRSGAPWRDLPERYGKWKTAHSSFVRWTNSGKLKAILDSLLLELDEYGYIDNKLWCADGSVVRAHRVAAGARHERGGSD